ncbi:MAG: hypothetical protein Aurels2KO_45550 [Aureliella sp.]
MYKPAFKILPVLWQGVCSVLRPLLAIVFGLVASPQTRGQSVDAASDSLSVMSWNIWHGGREDGEAVGPKRVVEVIRDSGADIVAVQETYGSGEVLAKSLGFHFHARGTNVSLLSRWPVVEDISIFEPFKCVGGIVELPSGRRIAVYSIWLPYGDDIWLPGVRDRTTTAGWLAACKPSASDLAEIYHAIEAKLAALEYAGIDVIVAGDFNSMSHLDYSAVAKDQFSRQVDWETSQVLQAAGFRDAYREVNPTVDRAIDSTWSPRFKEQEQDRIDFVYYRSEAMRCKSCENIAVHADGFPSDHAAVLARFQPRNEKANALSMRVATYNVRHGVGIDNKLDLSRTAAAIRKLDASIIGLQEIDLGTGRSGGENQMRVLGDKLGMHAAFGAFMQYDGGEYGLGVLSKFPIISVRSIRLTDGNEPRVALAVQVRLADGRVALFVCLHFDWGKNDQFRLQQAADLVKALGSTESPTVIVGDFNDSPGSRTIELFQRHFCEADKPEMQRLTWPADKPTVEIDYIFVDRSQGWQIDQVQVARESAASDHRPVVSQLSLPKARK